MKRTARGSTCARRLPLRRVPVVRDLDRDTRDAYRTAIDAADVPLLIGGAYAFECLTGIAWTTKDLDLFVRRRDMPRLRAALEKAGFETEIKFPHWLSKARRRRAQIDIVFGSANGLLPVDDDWFRHAIPNRLLGRRVALCPIEESIAQRAFVMERERFDGADVLHFIRLYGPRLDWKRLLARFGAHGRVLLSHLILFGYVYPGARECVPDWVTKTLLAGLENELGDARVADDVCRGGILSRAQYLIDFERWGYRDVRLPPLGNVSRRDLQIWTEAMAEDQPPELPRQSGPMRALRAAARRPRRAAG